MNKQEIVTSLDIKAFYNSEIPSLKWNGSGMGQGLCPFHEDHRPSLSVNRNTGQYKCFGCNSNGSLFDFYMVKHGVDFHTAKQELANLAGVNIETHKRIVKTYDYKNKSGDLLFQVVRYEPKGFSQRRPYGNGKWIYNLQGVQLAPYNLPEISKAKSIIICEGERDVDNLKNIGLIATCNPMGAGKWKPEYNDHFKGKGVVIIPDNDEPGLKHGQTIARNLNGIAESVKVVQLPGLNDKEDITDWLNKGGSKESLIEIIKDVSEWVPDERKFITSIEDILTEDTEPITWIVEEFLPEGGITLLTAPPSHYKTFMALALAGSVSQGVHFLGRTTQQKTIYYIEKENPRSVLKSYLTKLGVSKTNPLKVWPSWTEKEPPTFPDEVYLELAKEKPLMIFDSMIRFYPKGTEENSSTDMAQIMSFFRSLTKAGATILVLHHKGKGDSSDYRGSSDILGGVDIAYTIKRPENSNNLTLKCIKSRFSMEKDIPIEVISDDTNIRFEDATQKVTQAREREETEKLESLRDVICNFEEKENKSPNQSELINLSKEKGISKNETLELLKRGEGQFWKSESNGRGKAIHYKSIETTFPPFQPIYSNGKPERSESPLNMVIDLESENIEVIQ
jgi:5S rRNA maturation endonuclease (ribonuclease M5)